MTGRSRITVTEPPAENVPPVAEAGLPCQGDVGGTVRFDGSGSYDLNGDTLTYLWDFGDSSAGTGISPDHVYLTGGVREVTLTVTDPSGLAHTDTAEVRITDPDDIYSPVPALELEECPDIYDMYPVYGTISDTNPVTYKLQHREKGASGWITFAEGSGDSPSGLLGVFDPTMVRNGVHEIRLYTEDMSGNRSDITYPVIVDGNLKSAYAESVSGDMEFDAPGLAGLSLERTYDSRAQGTGDFGPGWSLPSSEVRATATEVIGEGWVQTVTARMFFGMALPEFRIAEARRHLIVIRLGDGTLLRFRPVISPDSGTGPLHYVTVGFSPAEGTGGTLRALDEGADVMLDEAGLLLTPGGRVYNPRHFRLTRPDGTVYVIHADRGIESMTDPEGNTVFYDDDGIHSEGGSISFERGADSRIERITGPYGRQITYHYDRDGMLVKVVQGGGSQGSEKDLHGYGYDMGTSDRPLLTEIRSHNEAMSGAFEYDSQGRMVTFFSGNPDDRGTDLEPLITGITPDISTRELSGTVNVEIYNSGRTDAERGYRVTVFEDRNGDGAFDGAEDNILGSAEVSEHPGKESVFLSIDVSGTLLFAGNRIFVSADTENDVEETDEEDNVTHTLADCASVQDCTDITASHIRTEDYDYPDSVTVTVRIGNAGTTDLPAGVKVSFWDGDPVYGGSHLETVVTENPQAPGEYEDVSFQWNEPPPGIHSVHIVADQSATGREFIPERDEENNHISSDLMPAFAGISPAIPPDGVTTLRIPAGTAVFGTRVTAENLTTGEVMTGEAGDDGLVLESDADITDRVRITLTDTEGRTVSLIRPFRDPDGTTVIGPDGGVVEGEGGIRAVVPPGAVPDATFVRLGGYPEPGADTDQELPEGFAFINGIDLEIRDADGNEIVAEEELKLSVPLPPGSGLSGDDELLILRQIRIFEGGNERTAYSLNNVAHIKDGRIETASPPFPGARASGPHIFVKPMYPAGFVIVTPSPMFGPSVTGMSCGDFGETFSDPLYHKTAPIFMIPGNRGFSVRIYSPAGDVLGEKSHSPREPADGFADLPISAPADEGTMTVSESFPADEAGDVPIRVKVSVLFSRQVYEKSVTAETFSLRDGANRPVVGKTEIIYSDENSEVAAGIRFTPDRRLSFGTEYRILIAGVRGFDEEQVVTETLTFTTFAPGVTGSADVEYPYDISILSHDRIAVADGFLGDSGGNSRGIVLLDVSDPENPVRLAEHPMSGNTFGVYAAKDTGIPGLGGQPVVLAVSGGMNSVSSFQVLKVTGENQDGLERAGATLITMDQTSLANGTCIARVPCNPGIPKAVTLYGRDNAYVATTGIGVQGISISDAVERTETDWPSNISEPGLFAETASPMAVETMGDTILAGDIRKLWLLTPDLNPDAAVSLNVPARAMHGIPDYPADLDGDGEIAGDERGGFVFVAGQDRTFYIVETGDAPEVVSEIRFDTYLRDVRVSPYDRTAYVSAYNGKVYIVDIDDPYEGTELTDRDGDGKDDRILGTVSGLSGAGALDIGENYGYAGDGQGRAVRVFPLRNREAKVSLILCPYKEGSGLRSRRNGEQCHLLTAERTPLLVLKKMPFTIDFNLASAFSDETVIKKITLDIENETGEAMLSVLTDGGLWEDDYFSDYASYVEKEFDETLDVFDERIHFMFKGTKPGRTKIRGTIFYTLQDESTVRELPVTGKMTVVVPGRLTLAENGNGTNRKTDGTSEDTTPSDNTLLLIPNSGGTVRLDMALTWEPADVPHEMIGSYLRWKIVNRDGSPAQNWSRTSDDFSDSPLSIAWNRPSSGPPNPEFKVYAWLDGNNNDLMDDVYENPYHRLLDVDILVLDRLTLTDHDHPSNMREDATPQSATPAKTLAMVTDSLNEARLDIDLTWVPTGVRRSDIGNMLRWEIEKKAGGYPVNWTTSVSGDFSGPPVIPIWKDPLSPSPNREFKVTAWIDKNKNGTADVSEEQRQLFVTIPEVGTKENPTGNNFGYDEISGSADEYISVDKAGTTFADVTVKPFVGKSFWATSSDPSKFTVPNSAVLITAATTPVEITGKNAGGPKESALLQIRIGSDTGDVIKVLHVEVYKKKRFNLDYYRIVDSASTAPSGTVPSANPTLGQLKSSLNDIFRQAVIEVNRINGNAGIDLPYDINHNGILDFYRGGNNRELGIIQNTTNAGTGQIRIALVKRVRDNWRLAASVAVGDSKIRLNSTELLFRGNVVTIGPASGPGGEVIKIINVNTASNEITLDTTSPYSAIKSPHPLGETVYRRVCGLATDPQLIADSSSPCGNQLFETVAHEILHRAYLGNLKDIAETDNIMMWNTGGTPTMLRYRGQTVVQPGNGRPTGVFEKQWDEISR